MIVAFLGLGRMGVRMAAHVARADHELLVWNRTPGRADALTALGAREASYVEEAVAGADRVVLMMFGPDSVREVLPRITAAAPAGALVIDSTTVGPGDALEFGKACAAAGLRYVDAPVAGSLAPAAEGTLGVLVGAAEQDYADSLPLLSLWGTPDKIRRVGDVGAGSAMKLCVNQGLGVMAAGVGESLRLGRDLGLDRTALLDILGSTVYAPFLNQKRPMLAARDYSGTTFSLDLLVKDLGLALEAGDAQLAVTRASYDQGRRALAAGHGGEDYAALAGHLADVEAP